MTYAQRRRRQLLVYLFCIQVILMPSSGMSSARAEQVTQTPTRDADMETFRNPQISSSMYNRFLMSHSSRELLCGGGQAFKRPGQYGYGNESDPNALWLPNKGRLVWSDVDIRIPGFNEDLLLQRVYRGSVSTYEGVFGNNWDANWNKRLRVDSSTGDVTLHDRGRLDVYEYDSVELTWTSPPGRYDVLWTYLGYYQRTNRQGGTEWFGSYPSSGSDDWYVLEWTYDLNDNYSYLDYYYLNGEYLLRRAYSNAGLRADLEYNSNGHVTRITDWKDREWRYEYTASAPYNLTKVIQDPDPDHSPEDLSREFRYEYDGSNRLVSVFQPEDGGSSPTWGWEYDGDGRITHQSFNGHDTEITYDEPSNKVTVDDPESNRTIYSYNSDLLITERNAYVDVSTYHTTTWEYNSDHEVTRVTLPGGNEVAYDYDDSGNILTVRHFADSQDGTPITWAYSYATNGFLGGKYSRLTKLTDPNGNEWSYQYDNFGNLTKTSAPAVTLPSGIASSDLNVNMINDGTIAVEYSYDLAGRLVTITKANGTLTALTWGKIQTGDSEESVVTEVVNDVGGLALTTTYSHDDYGNTDEVTSPGGDSVSYEYDLFDRLAREVAPEGVIIRYGYDKNDNLTSRSQDDDNDAASGDYDWDMSFDQAGNIVSLVMDFDGSTRLVTEYGYDLCDRLTLLVEGGIYGGASGTEITEYSYDGRDSRTGITRDNGSGADVIFSYAYDGNANLTQITDGRGNATDLAYDKYDRLTRRTRPESDYWTRTYDPAGNIVAWASYNTGATKLAETSYAYDEANRLYQVDILAKRADLATSLGDGLQTRTLSRDEEGRVLSVSGDLCGCAAMEYVYDALGRVLTQADTRSGSAESYIAYAYDSDGNVITRWRHDATEEPVIEGSKTIETRYQYDQRDRMTKIQEVSSSGVLETTLAYGKRDQLTSVTDAVGDVTTYKYNELLKLTEEAVAITGSDDVITSFLYEPNGRRMTYRASNPTTGTQDTVYQRDRLGRLVQVTWPDAETTVYTYDGNSNRISTQDPNGTLIVCAYDENDRVTAKDITLATNVVGPDALAFGYDALDRVTSADATEDTSFSSVVERTYNTLGLVESETQIIDGYASGAGRTITYDWSIDGRRTGVTYPISGDVITYDRDDLGRVDAISRNSTSLVAYTYSGNRLLQKSFPGSTATYTYDSLGRLTNILHQNKETTPGAETLAKFRYLYDSAHQITGMDRLYYDDSMDRITADPDLDLGMQFEYDEAKRLVSALRGVPTVRLASAMADNITAGGYFDEFVEYKYDATGNRVTMVTDDGSSETTVTYAHNTVNEMTTEDGVSRSYYDNGGFSGVGSRFKYTYSDQLGEYEDSNIFPVTYTYHYDAFGRLVQRDRSGASNKQRNYYDGWEIVEKPAWNGSTETHKKTYVFGPAIDELVLYVDVDASPDLEYYSHADHLGSIQLMVDVGGVVQESYRYTEFGVATILDDSFAKLSAGASSPIGNAHRYTGRREAGVLGNSTQTWYDYRMRHYRADLGRFVQRDPLGYLDGPSLYQYVRASPMMHMDPMGLLGGGLGDTMGAGGKIAESLIAVAAIAAVGIAVNTAIAMSPPENSAEQAVIDKMSVGQKVDFYDAAATAFIAGVVAEPSTLNGGETPLGDGNAMRHCVFSCELGVKAAGRSDAFGKLAKEFVEAHEIHAKGADPDSPVAKDSDTDRKNNKHGVDSAKEVLAGKADSCTDACGSKDLIAPNGSGK